MKKFILVISIIFFSSSILKAEIDLFSEPSTLLFSNKKETLELGIVYNNDDDIWLYVTYNKPITSPKFEDGIYNVTSTTQLQPQSVTIHFWLSNFDGVKQEYVYVNTIKGKQTKHHISKKHYDAIASNLHSISIGNKWKLVKKDESGEVREFFIKKIVDYKNTEVNACKYLVKQMNAENITLENENQSLKSYNKQLSENNTELEKKLQNAIETIKDLQNKQHPQPKPSSVEQKKPKVKKNEETKETHKVKKYVVTYVQTDKYTEIIKTTKELEYESNKQTHKLPKGSILQITKVKNNTTNFSLIKNDTIIDNGSISTKFLMKHHINVKKVVTEI